MALAALAIDAQWQSHLRLAPHPLDGPSEEGHPADAPEGRGAPGRRKARPQTATGQSDSVCLSPHRGSPHKGSPRKGGQNALRPGLAGWLLVGMLALWTTNAPAAQGEDAETRRQLGDVVEQLNALDTWLTDADRRMASQQKELANADRRIDEITRQMRELSRKQTRAETSVQSMQDQRASLEAARKEQAQRIPQHIRDAWRHPRRDLFKTLLNQESPDEFDRTVRMHGYFVRARVEALAEYRATLQALADNADRAASERLVLTQARVSLQERRKALVQTRSDRERAIGILQAELQDRAALRERLQQDRDRLESLLTALAQRPASNAASREVPPVLFGLDLVESRGKLPWPVQGEIVNRFGQNRAGGRMTWEGVQFSASPGEDVIAVANGRVVFAEWLRGFGLLTIVDHGDGHMSLYGHSDAIYRKEGEWVSGGEAIASAGQSGGRADVGVYFEVRAGGQPTDPMTWLGNP